MVGINTAVIAMAQGLSFAIPIDTANWVASQLLTRGRVARANLGFAGQQRPLDRRLARTHQLSTLQAVEIVAVEARGPASRAGLWEGDLLVAVNGRPVGTVDDVHRMPGGVAHRGALDGDGAPRRGPLRSRRDTGGDALRAGLTGPALAEPGHEGRETVCMGLRRPDRSLTPRC